MWDEHLSPEMHFFKGLHKVILTWLKEAGNANRKWRILVFACIKTEKKPTAVWHILVFACINSKEAHSRVLSNHFFIEGVRDRLTAVFEGVRERAGLARGQLSW
jgi:hypothetical protein